MILLADGSKIPEDMMVTLRARSGNAEIVDLNHEVHYDDKLGGAVSNIAVVIDTVRKIFGPAGWRAIARMVELMLRHRPAVCLSLWDAHLPLVINAVGAPCAILQVATQSIMYEEGRGHNIILDVLYLLNLGYVGEMLTVSDPPGGQKL